MLFAKSILSLSLFVIASPVFAAGAVAHSGGLQMVQATDGRQVLATTQGLSVYTFDPDNADLSVCKGGCLKEWPAVAPANGDVTAPFGTIRRDDGTMQLTIHHKPLYTFVEDNKVGDIAGDGDDGVWHVVTSVL